MAFKKEGIFGKEEVRIWNWIKSSVTGSTGFFACWGEVCAVDVLEQGVELSSCMSI